MPPWPQTSPQWNGPAYQPEAPSAYQPAPPPPRKVAEGMPPPPKEPMPEPLPERFEESIEVEPEPEDLAPYEPERLPAEEEAPEYIEEPALDGNFEDGIETGSMDEDLEFAEVPEDIWGDGKAEEAPRFDEPAPVPEGAPPSEEGLEEATGGHPEPSREKPAQGGTEQPSAGEGKGRAKEEPLLGEPTARLLEYLKGLADELPPGKKEEFDVEGLKTKIDDLIGKIKREAERSREPPPVLTRESGFGLLSAGQALRAADPRRAAEGRRALAARRAENDRRAREERRKWGERREGERRGPVPSIDLSIPITRDAAPVTVADDGTPTAIAGVSISPRMAKLIQIMRREKDNAR